MRDRLMNLTTPEDVTAFLERYPNSVLFKAGTCHKTMQGFGFVQEQLEARTDLIVGLIRVVEARPASNLIAERTGIRHESPQVILFKEGQAVFDVDNWNITPEVLAEGFARVPNGDPVEPGGASEAAAEQELRPYVRLLEAFLGNEIDEREFEFSYTTLFRDDASLRSKEEVEILNSIFGDVDKHMTMHMMMAGREHDQRIRENAQAAYDRLRSYLGQAAS